jgi:hypothetical protein
MKLLVMQLSPPSRHSIPLQSNYSPQYPVLKYPQLCSSLIARDQVPHTYRTVTCNGVLEYNIMLQFVRFEVLTAVTMKNCVFCDVTPCGSCKNLRFGGTYCVLHQDDENR